MCGQNNRPHRPTDLFACFLGSPTAKLQKLMANLPHSANFNLKNVVLKKNNQKTCNFFDPPKQNWRALIKAMFIKKQMHVFWFLCVFLPPSPSKGWWISQQDTLCSTGRPWLGEWRPQSCRNALNIALVFWHLYKACNIVHLDTDIDDGISKHIYHLYITIKYGLNNPVLILAIYISYVDWTIPL